MDYMAINKARTCSGYNRYKPLQPLHFFMVFAIVFTICQVERSLTLQGSSEPAW